MTRRRTPKRTPKDEASPPSAPPEASRRRPPAPRREALDPACVALVDKVNAIITRISQRNALPQRWCGAAESFVTSSKEIFATFSDVGRFDEWLKEWVDAIITCAKHDVRQVWGEGARRAAVAVFEDCIDPTEGEIRVLPSWLRESSTPAPTRRITYTPGFAEPGDDEELNDEIVCFLEDLGVDESELCNYNRAEVSAEARRVGLSMPARNHILAMCRSIDRVVPPTLPVGTELADMVKAEVNKLSKCDFQEAKPDGIAAARARLARLNVNPTVMIKQCLDNHQAREDWPLAGTQFSARLAGEYLARVYAGGLRATEYYRNWIRVHSLENCKHSHEVLFHAAVLDGLLMVDEINVSNSYACELLARRCYGFELVYADCHSRDQWKSKAKMKMLDVYDASSLDRAGPRVGAADLEARKALEVEASFNKWLAKAPASAE